MFTLSILQLNGKKVIPLFLSLNFSELVLTVLSEALRNATTFRLFTLNTQRQILYMTLITSCRAVNVSMGDLGVMRRMRLAT